MANGANITASIRAAKLACIVLAFGTAPALAQVDKYHVTEAEKVACMGDAQQFCMFTYPSEDRLIACMRTNQASLSSTCAPVFKAGLRRRGL